MQISALRQLLLVATAVQCVHAQHYCWPCAKDHGVIGKDTHAAHNAPACYDWYLKYLNSLAEASNTGPGYHKASLHGQPITETWDVPPNALALESNECGTSIGDFQNGVSHPMTGEQKRLVQAGQRLATGRMHQCPCALGGRAHIINGSATSNTDYAGVEAKWGKQYTDRIRNVTARTEDALRKVMTPEEFASADGTKVFGVHAISCPFHRSGPCTLQEVEQGVARSWANNFSRGYQPLWDNNLLLWTRSLKNLLDSFIRDEIEFYPMRWLAKINGTERQVYSVLASPCGKLLYEVAALDPGGRPADQFHHQPIPRAVFERWNQPAHGQPVVPLRISRAIPADKMDAVLDFYGAGPRVQLAKDLGFNTTVLADVKADGLRAVTLMLSSAATVHVQLVARDESEPAAGPSFPGWSEFELAVRSNQVSGGQPPSAKDFCESGKWSVARYSQYISQVHATVMTAPPAPGYDVLLPPVGEPMDVFLDDHIAWDCTSPECDMAAGGKALYQFGSRIQWVFSVGFQIWTPYSHDPAGYGFQLHWYAAPANFSPHGPVYPECFGSYPNGTCSGALPTLN